MSRPIKDRLDVGFLDHATAIHHNHSFGDLSHDPQVVRNEHDCGPEFLLNLLNQFENLRLNRHIERGRWLIGNQQTRTVDERHGDHNALPHASAEFVRIRIDALRGLGNANFLKRVEDDFAYLRF